MSLYRVRVTLARNSQFPEGSPTRGYDFIVPLTEAGTLDPAAWKVHSKDCLVHRFWEGEAPQHGLLMHKGQHWFIDYDLKTQGDEEPFYRLASHAIEEGNYVSITEQDGAMHTFHIVSVKPLAA